MRYATTLCLFLLGLATLSAQRYNYGDDRGEKVRGNGDITTESRNVNGNFTGIDVCCAIKVELTQASSNSIRVEADENILEYVITEIEGDDLHIHFRKGINVRTTKAVKVYVNLAELDEIEASGAAQVMTMGTFNGDELEIDCNSASVVKIDFQGNEVSVDVNSAAIVELEGRSQRIELEASSAGRIDAKEHTASEAEAKANSAAVISIGVTDKLNADANSAASIRYRGNPDKLYTDTNSGGRVKKI